LRFSIWNPHLVIPEVKGDLLRKVPNKTQVTKLKKARNWQEYGIPYPALSLLHKALSMSEPLNPLAESFAPYKSKTRITLDLMSRNNRIASESSGDLSQSMWAEAFNDQGTLSFLPSMNPDATEDLRGTPETSINLFTTPTRLLGPILQLPFKLSLTSNHK
jgi:hypothetical protein